VRSRGRPGGWLCHYVIDKQWLYGVYVVHWGFDGEAFTDSIPLALKDKNGVIYPLAMGLTCETAAMLFERAVPMRG
jgi:hypothetical protein